MTGNLDTINIKQPFDFSIFGGLDSNGSVITKKGKEAINNALRSWLLSKEGDYIRQPQKGGFLYYWLTKPMSDENQEQMLVSLIFGIEQDFIPYIVIQNLQVIPDFEKRKWTIIMQGFVPLYKQTINFKQDFKSLI